LGINLGLVTGVPRRAMGHKPWYDFLVAISEFRDSLVSQQFLAALDDELSKLNFLWRARRKEGVLAPPRLLRLPSSAWDEYVRQELSRRGTGDYQYKHPGLVKDQSWLANFSPVDSIVLE
jgi:hypothetical protein